MKKIKVEVNSEIGKLEAVILHTPGTEVENMIPENTQRALYSDILNLSEVRKEFSQFKEIVEKHTKIFLSKIYWKIFWKMRPSDRHFSVIFSNMKIFRKISLFYFH